jgi:hypothetical protein
MDEINYRRFRREQTTRFASRTRESSGHASPDLPPAHQDPTVWRRIDHPDGLYAPPLFQDTGAFLLDQIQALGGSH